MINVLRLVNLHICLLHDGSVYVHVDLTLNKGIHVGHHLAGVHVFIAATSKATLILLLVIEKVAVFVAPTLFLEVIKFDLNNEGLKI